MGPCGTEVGTNAFYVGALFPQFPSFPGCWMACFAVKRGLARWEEGTERLESEDRVVGLCGCRAVGSIEGTSALSSR